MSQQQPLTSKGRIARLGRHLTAAGIVGRFVSLEEGAAMKEGTRVSHVAGFPALFAEALRNLAFVKGIDITYVKHPNMGIDRKTGLDRQARLIELTAQSSLPVMWHGTERPRSNWTEQLALCERLGKPGTPALLPADQAERADVFGLCALILAEDGLVWNCRIRMDTALGRKYGWSPEAAAEAEGKIMRILQHIAARLEAQAVRGSKFLVGDAVSAVDIYLATMSYNLIVPSEELLPRTKQNRVMSMMFGNLSPSVAAVVEGSRIFEHREYIIKTFCEAGTSVGGTLL